ncbi:hypothetical protein LLEC1_02452 [Akanthomyces lecanii]|uniref:ASST-domain-containing protein n=1 Tax=Cordyceps confragosa TaxID=2714763 RepID=A0A179IIC5_CORDF|nr:hypothetical protein LLEC1_02452 [Akanthomyces lecanii]
MLTLNLFALALWSAGTTAWPSQTYKSEPFVIPEFNVTKSGESLAPGYLFLTPASGSYPAAIIITDEGELVWASNNDTFYNFNVQTLDSKSVLTYWEGVGSPNPDLKGHGYGQVKILDSSYTVTHTICPDFSLNGASDAKCQADLHESYVTDRGSVLVTAYNLTQADLSDINGPEQGWIYDCLIYEIDIETQNILFKWSALQSGIPLTDSKEPLGDSGTQSDPYDAFHLNSAQSVEGGYLINSRHTWTTYFVEPNGAIQWRFEAWQHHVRILNGSSTGVVLSMFDNANAEPPLSGVNQTLGLVFTLDLGSNSSTLLREYKDPSQPLYTDSQGALDLLPNGNALQGYGQLPIVKEYGPDGDVRMSIQFGDLDAQQEQSSYRAYRLEWEGVPAADPVVVAEQGYAYASWNGATDVSGWDIYEGTTAENVVFTHSVTKNGFETEAIIFNTTKYVKAAAVYTTGKRDSAVVAVA